MLKSWKTRVPIGLGIVLVIVLLFYVWLLVYFTIGEDLVIDLSSNQTSFRITNQEQALVLARLESRGQLFCTTQCDIELLDSTGQLQYKENFTTSSGAKISREFPLKPRDRGTGQMVYSLRASCYNMKSIICPSTGSIQRDSVLLTLNYELPKDAATQRKYLLEKIPVYFKTITDLDEKLQGINILLQDRRLHPGQILAELAPLQERFVDARMSLERIKQEWADENYLAAANIVANHSLDLLDSDLNKSNDIKYEVLALPVRHNTIRDRLNASRNQYSGLLQNYSFLIGDQNVAPDFISAITVLNNTIKDYADDNYLQYASFEDRLVDLENISVLQDSLTLRTATVELIGKALLQSELDSQCALNVSIACRNTTAATVPALCDELLANSTNITMNSTFTFIDSYCIPRTLALDNQSLIGVNVTTWPVVISSIDTTLSDNAAQCCVFGKCQSCCVADSCSSDSMTYPVIFVHGHAFNAMNTPEYSLGGYFADIQQSLESDGYIDAGIITPSSLFSEVSAGEWGLSGRPVSARVTYYYNFYKNGDEYVLIAQKSESIETYAIRLNEMINIVKHHTGKSKVNIVAHSMGGLVTRRYLQLFGDESVDKVILIGTPNNGTQGRTNTLCPVFGETKECADMAQGSVFMSKVNDPVAQPRHAKFTTIAGSGCSVAGQDGDGVVTVNSVALPYAKNYVINGTCTDLLDSELHTELLNINKYPKIYEIVRSALQAK